MDAFTVKNLDLQGELNICRPFMYTSYSNLQTYTNFYQPMAHPLGANFYEMVGIIRFQPIKKLFLQVKGISYQIGYDTPNVENNVGQNIALSYNYARHADFGNFITQGMRTNVLLMDYSATYMLKQNVFIDAKATYRSATSQIAEMQMSKLWLTMAIRINIVPRNYDF
jgi:hypothetical protein